jgi:hypothetical protein
MKQGWFRSMLFTLLGTDRARDCYDPTVRRRGNPADAFTKRNSGNDFWMGYKGTTSEQLASLASDLQAQIGGFLKSQGIAHTLTVTSSFAGTGQAQIKFTIGQEAITVKGRREPERNAFIWNNI